jgi:dihydrodipicolinate synthase/N-acetylneuraminate lyase
MGTARTLGGVIPILPTPFNGADEVDLESVKALVDFAASAGVTAIGTPAYASEFYKLDGTERTRIIETSIAHSAGRLPVIAQCNHYSPRHAARLAVEAEKMGAAAINVALPRAFPSAPRQLLDYARAVCDAVSLPVVIQDWSPSGGSVGLPFALELRRHCPNFRFLKLEDAGIGPLIRAIRRETSGEIGVFVGWGGMYLMEMQPAGACGIMPGLGVADVLVRVWQLACEEKWPEAFALFARILPYIHFSLQTLEQHHHVEKHLLMARGVLRRAAVRPVTVELSDDSRRYMDFLIDQLRPLIGSPR